MALIKNKNIEIKKLISSPVGLVPNGKLNRTEFGFVLFLVVIIVDVVWLTPVTVGVCFVTVLSLSRIPAEKQD